MSQTNTKFNWIKKSVWLDLKDKVPTVFRRLSTKRFRKANKAGLEQEHQKGFSDHWY